MGHQRIGTLPDTVGWRRVVATIAGGAAVAEVAAATTEAAADGLSKARNDPGPSFCVCLLGGVARAAHAGNFADNLRDLGLDVPDAPGLFDVTAAFADKVDRHLAVAGRRTDFGEMAELAAVESLTAQLGERSSSLYGADSDDLQRAARELSTPRGFGTLAHDFFARFAQRFLTYHLGRELPLHVGGNGRFADPSEHNDFVRRLEIHCREAAEIMHRFARDWYSRAHAPDGEGITPASAKRFVAHALKKLRDELTDRGGRHGD